MSANMSYPISDNRLLRAADFRDYDAGDVVSFEKSDTGFAVIVLDIGNDVTRYALYQSSGAPLLQIVQGGYRGSFLAGHASSLRLVLGQAKEIDWSSGAEFGGALRITAEGPIVTAKAEQLGTPYFDVSLFENRIMRPPLSDDKVPSYRAWQLFAPAENNLRIPVLSGPGWK